MKKILIVTGNNVYNGGVEIVTKSIVNIIQNLYFSYTILTYQDIIEQSRYSSFLVILSKILGKPFVTSLYFKRINNNFDLIICNGEYSFGINSKNTIVLFHGSMFSYRKSLKKYLSLFNKVSLMRYDYMQRIGAKNKYVVSVSEFAKNGLEKSGIQVNEVISNGIDLNLFHPTLSSKKFDLLMIGAFGYKGYAKGYDILENIQKLTKYNILTVSSEKPIWSNNWFSYIENTDLVNIYNQCRILLLPSRYEACPMVVLEALSCGIPVITNSVGVSSELSSYSEYYVVTNNNVAEYILKIDYILNNYDYFRNLSRKIATEIFSSQIFINKWSKLIYEKVYQNE